MNISKEKIRRCFNRARLSYDRHCQLQIEIGRTLIAAANCYQMRPATVIDLGCGTGLVTQILQNTLAHQRLWGVDIAEDLLNLARRRLHPAAQLCWSDFDNIPSSAQQFDLVFSNMALQWSSDFSATLKEITRVIKNQGHLVFSLPVAGTFSVLKHWLYRQTGKSYLNEFMPVAIIHQALKQAGYRIRQSQINQYSQKFSSVRDALHSLKPQLGVSVINLMADNFMGSMA